MKAVILSIFTALASFSVASASGPIEITKENFEDKIKGKNAFVKFFASWCGHCKSMKPAWDQLGEEYEASSSVLIGDAECTASGKALCDEFQVSGYPTIKYFVDGDTKGEDYKGGRDFDSLKKFVVETLEVKCSVKDPVECSDKEKGYIDKMQAKSSAERVAQIERLEKMAAGKMKADLKEWLHQRLHILRELEA
eukprot:scaffold25176_cov191-Cylindrotheca_fusiformis.AAC.5